LYSSGEEEKEEGSSPLLLLSVLALPLFCSGLGFEWRFACGGVVVVSDVFIAVVVAVLVVDIKRGKESRRSDGRMERTCFMMYICAGSNDEVAEVTGNNGKKGKGAGMSTSSLSFLLLLHMGTVHDAVKITNAYVVRDISTS